MRRLGAVLGVLVLLVASGVLPALASDDDRSGSDSATSRSGDDDDRDDDDDDRDDDDRDDDDDDHDDDDDRDDDDDDRRRRHRNRNGGHDDDRARDGTGSGGTGSGASPPSGPASTAATVRVGDRSFSPQTVTIAVGGTVTWTNVSRDHTVTADDDSFDSGVFDAGQDFQHTFDTAGTFDYLCLIHPEMTGTVVVGDGAAAQGSGSTAGAPASSSPSTAGARRSASSGQPSLGSPSLPAPLAAAGGGTADVEVRDFEFAPDDLTVAPGTTVRWTFTGRAPHTVTADGFDSGMLQEGDTFEQTFSDVGTVAYRCDLHPEMTGTVSVVEGAAAAASDGSAGSDAATGGDGATPSVPTSALANTGVRGQVMALIALMVLAGGGAAVLAARRRSRRA